MSVLNLRDHILAAKDLKEELVHMDEWGVDVLVRGLNGRQRAAIYESGMRKDGTPDLKKLQPDLLIACVHDPETGKPVFEQADRDVLLEKSGVALDRITEVAFRLSGLDTKGKDAEKSGD